MEREKQQTLEVRYIKPEDRETILALEGRAHRFGPKVDPRAMKDDSLNAFAERERSRMYVATADEKLVGYLFLDAGEEDCRIVRLTVEPRRRGSGTALLKRAQATALKAGCVRLVAEVYEEDLAAQNFFKAKGFRAEPVKKAIEFNGPAVRFVKSIG